MKPQHYILSKGADLDRHGRSISATEAAKALLEKRIWALSSNASCQDIIKAGDHVYIYLSGKANDSGQVIAKATIDEVKPWTRRSHVSFPLWPSKQPSKILALTDIEYLNQAVLIKDHIDQLDFVPVNKKQWSLLFTGGLRKINESDFNKLFSISIGNYA
ncbi:hypothetical protein HUO09_17730 [Vibrio sp. Y2-5]|uniref:hypothetical protein n=1 Tax=Vibrio sp. Y2-5 TaxID=2743977 RepID=UPI0016617E3A|nr:hypothetical protein [Vibrio sp. Y2-5]MBD0788199.1 hypothetical protein [Vibrio sp. Y2-5]